MRKLSYERLIQTDCKLKFSNLSRVIWLPFFPIKTYELLCCFIFIIICFIIYFL